MPVDRFRAALCARSLPRSRERGTQKGAESRDRRRPPRRRRARPALSARRRRRQAVPQMNSNNYLGMALRPELSSRPRSRPSRAFGVGPGAVRFISGTYARARRAGGAARRLPRPRGGDDLQLRLRHRCSAVLVPLITPETVRDQRRAEPQLHHQRDAAGAPAATRRSTPTSTWTTWTRSSPTAAGTCAPGDRGHRRHLQHARRPRPAAEDRRRSPAATTTQLPGERRAWWSTTRTASAPSARPAAAPRSTPAPRASTCWSATLGKAFGVNGGYVVGRKTLIDFLRETSPIYIYSNPITAGEAAAALARRRDPRQPRGRRAARPSPRDDRALRAGPRRSRLRDHPRRAPGGAADGPRHRQDHRAGRPPARPRHPGHRPEVSRWCRTATRRSASRSRADHTESDVDQALSVLASFA